MSLLPPLPLYSVCVASNELRSGLMAKWEHETASQKVLKFLFCLICRVPGTNQESPGLVATGTRWMQRIKATTSLPEGVLSVQLFVPDMFGNDVLVTR